MRQSERDYRGQLEEEEDGLLFIRTSLVDRSHRRRAGLARLGGISRALSCRNRCNGLLRVPTPGSVNRTESRKASRARTGQKRNGASLSPPPRSSSSTTKLFLRLSSIRTSPSATRSCCTESSATTCPLATLPVRHYATCASSFNMNPTFRFCHPLARMVYTTRTCTVPARRGSKRTPRWEASGLTNTSS